jgi:FtsX-like permease family
VLKNEGGLEGYRRSRFRNGLVVAQMALSLLLLIAAGLIVRSLQQVQMIGPGFEVENRITMSVDLGLQGYDEARGREFYKQLISRVESLPGVRGASYIDSLPLNLDFNGGTIYVEGQPFTRASDLPLVPYGLVWPRYFETMGVPLLEGRDFTMRDDKDESRFVIVNETFARRFWPGQNPMLAGLGVYGVMAYAVSQRTREIGLRMALGARGGDVMRLVVRQGMRLALIGLLIGLAGALVLTRLMSSVLYGVSATDVVTFAGVTLLLGLVVLIACYLPARRAAKVDPIIAIRCE